MTYQPNSRPVSDWTDLKYRYGGHVAHLVPFGRNDSLCQLITDAQWYGTGDFDEIEHAQALPTCGMCLATAGPTATADPDPAVAAWSDAFREKGIAPA